MRHHPIHTATTMASNERAIVPWDDDNCEESIHHPVVIGSDDGFSLDNEEEGDDDHEGISSGMSTIATYEDVHLRLSQDKFYGRGDELSKLVELYHQRMGRKETNSDGEDMEETNKSQNPHFRSTPMTDRKEMARPVIQEGIGSPLSAVPPAKKARKMSKSATANTTTSAPAEVVLVAGCPGTGKTTLIQKFVATARSLVQKGEAKPFYFLTGKYEDLQRADPLSALVDAFSGLVRDLVDASSQGESGTPGGSSELRRIRKSILAALGGGGGEKDDNNPSGKKSGSEDEGGVAGGGNYKVLMDLIPDLRIIFWGEDSHLGGAGGRPSASSIAADKTSSGVTAVAIATSSTGPQEEQQPSRQSTALARVTDKSASTTEVEDSLNRIKYIFQLFVKAVCTSKRPIVLFLDDLQWADSLSLDLLSTLLMDQDLQHLLFVGAYRSNQVKIDDLAAVSTPTNMDWHNLANTNQRRPFASWIQTIDTDRRSLPPIQRISLENHLPDAITDCIADTLGKQREEITELAKCIYNKTHGNIFFVLQALQELRRQNIIKFSSTTREWEWDETDVELGDALSDNVVEVVVGKLQSLPSPLQVTLRLAALLRSSFDSATLFALIQDRRKSSTSRSSYKTPSAKNDDDKNVDERTMLAIKSHADLIRLLDIAVVEGLLENSIGSSSYKFAHDKIQEAAYCLVSSDEERDKMRLQVGKFFVARAIAAEGDEKGRGAGSDEWMLFAAADHLNSLDPSSLDGVSTLDVAKLNLRVGQKAVRVAAFASASQYFLKGIDALQKLPSSPWRSHYDLAYEMYNSSASALLALGSYALCVAHSQEILNNAKTLLEQFPAYWSMEGSLSRQQRHVEAMKLSQTVAERLGVFPKRFHALHLARAFFEVRSLFRKHSDEDSIHGLPVITDTAELASMRFLSRIALRAMLCDNNVVLLLATLRQVIYTFRYGLCGEGAYAVASYGMILCGSLGHVEAGKRMGPLAKQIRQRCNARHVEAKVATLVTHYIDAWSMPLTQILDAFQQGYQAGMETGDVEFAGWNSACGNWTAYHAGYPLGTLLENGNSLLRNLVQFNVTSVVGALYPIIKFYEYLMGSKKPNWNAIDTETHVSDDDLSIDVTFDLLTHCYLAYFFGRYDLAERLLERWSKKKQSAGDRAYINISTTTFFKGLIAAAMGRTTGKRRYRSIAEKASKTMREMVRSGSVTDVHRSYVLDAEVSASFLGKGGSSPTKEYLVMQKFELAISAATEAGFVQDAALANELAGEYYLRVGQEQRASLHLTLAHGLYKQWGAHAKAGLLRERHKDHLDVTDTSPSTFMTASVVSDTKSRQVLHELYSSWGNSRGLSIDLDDLPRRMAQSVHQCGNDTSSGTTTIAA
jgi:predicted ATPase